MLRTIEETQKKLFSRGEGGTTKHFQIEPLLPLIPHLEGLGKRKPTWSKNHQPVLTTISYKTVIF